jgi:hypothetical protein
MTDPTPQRRRPHPTPAWLVYGLLGVEGLLWLSERFSWFPFNHHKGWTVLIAVASVGVAMLLMLGWFIVALVFRWRFQFSIRSLLVLAVAVALPSSWLALEMKAAREQREVADEIRKVGGSAGYDWQFDADGSEKPNAQPPTVAWLRNLLGDDLFAVPVFVCLDNTKTTDAGLENLKSLTKLRWLYLGMTQITDAGLERLKDFNHPQLGTLNVSLTKVTDVGLKSLEGLARLDVLLLDDTQVTDAGLDQIEGLRRLRALSLSGTKLTDTGLERLKGLPRLEWLAIYKTKVTDAGVKKLQHALPNCKIER